MLLSRSWRTGLLAAFGYSFLLGSTCAQAETYSSYSVTGAAGMGTLESRGHAALQQLYGVRLGYDVVGDGVTDSAGIEAVSNYLHGTDGKDAFLVRLDYLFQLIPKERLVPFVALGAGGILTRGDSGLVLALGGGAKYFLNDHLVLRGDLRDSLVSHHGASPNNVEFTVGVSYLFGRHAEPMPANNGTKGAVPVEPGSPAAMPAPVPGNARIPEPAESDELDERPPLPPAVPEIPESKDSTPLPSDTAPPGVQPRQETRAAPKLAPEPAASPASALATFPASAAPPAAALNALPVRVPTPVSAALSLSAAPNIDGQGTPACSDAQPADCGKVAALKETATPGNPPGKRGPTLSDRPEENEPSLGVVHDVKSAVTIGFNTGEFAVPAANYPQLEQVALQVNDRPNLRVVIAGHTDDRGNAHQNYLLSRKRAQSVKAYLVRVLHVDPKRVTAKGYGPYQPLSNKKTAGERRRNRRTVVIVVTTKEKP